MRLYLKSGQMIYLKEVHTIACGKKTYGVGKFYDKETDSNYVSKSLIYPLCKRQENKNMRIEFYYDMTKMFCTNTDEIVAVEV